MCIVAAAPLIGLVGAGATAAGTAGIISASTAAYLSLGSTVLGSLVSAVGKSQDAKAQAGQYNYQAAVDRNNKIISDRQAQDAIDRGKAAEEEHRRKVSSIKSDQRVGFASRGIDLGSDVVTETLSDTAMLGELDALTIRSNAQRESYGFKIQGMNYEASAGNNTLAAKNAKKAGTTSMFSTLLSGGATVAGNYSDYKNKGIL